MTAIVDGRQVDMTSFWVYGLLLRSYSGDNEGVVLWFLRFLGGLPRALEEASVYTSTEEGWMGVLCFGASTGVADRGVDFCLSLSGRFVRKKRGSPLSNQIRKDAYGNCSLATRRVVVKLVINSDWDIILAVKYGRVVGEYNFAEQQAVGLQNNRL